MITRRWGISARSAAMSAAVVLTAFVLAAVGLLILVHQSLVSGVDNATAARVADVAVALQTETPAELDARLMATDHRIVAVQVVDADGRILRHSDGAPRDPLLGSERVNTRTVTTGEGTYTVLVGGGTAAVETTMGKVALLLTAGAALVTPVAAAVSFLMVKRSLRSVEAMRSQVAEISGAADLSSRVPVPVSRDEISALAVTMNGMLNRIESGQAVQRRFVGDASHELRAPLDTMLTALREVEAQPHLIDCDLVSATLLPEAHRMKALVEDLLFLARVDERGLSPRRERVRVDELVDVEAARFHTGEGVRIVVDAEQFEAEADQVGLSRVVRNLLDNAVRHARSAVTVSARTIAGSLVLTVADDGPGIAESDRARVFTRFVRLDEDRSGGGTGLGLAIVAEIVAAHGGAVGVGESYTGGAEFTVTIPLRQ